MQGVPSGPKVVAVVVSFDVHFTVCWLVALVLVLLVLLLLLPGCK